MSDFEDMCNLTMVIVNQLGSWLLAKDHELRQAVKDYESQLVQVTQSLAEFKLRAFNAEVCFFHVEELP